MSLTEAQINIIKATVPILKSNGVDLTSHFYELMFREDGITKPFFNQGHQADKSQPKALAYSLLCVASNIETIAELLASPEGTLLINQIVCKHVALDVRAEHYPIVGKNLLRAIREVLGAETATDEVLEAWGVVYGIVSGLLIGAEAAMYQELAATTGGWNGQRDFQIIDKIQETPTAIRYVIQSADKQVILTPRGGQYLTLRIEDDVNNVDTMRNYSICDVVGVDQDGIANIYEFTTELVPGSVIPHYLSQFKNVGDILKVHVPAGEFTLEKEEVVAKDNEPIVFLAAGSGITPYISMAKEARKMNPQREINLIHIIANDKKQLLKGKVDELKEKYNINVVIYNTAVQPKLHMAESYEQASDEYKVLLKDMIINKNVQEKNVYVVGPKNFMLSTFKALKELLPGFVGNAIRMEAFGPHPSLEKFSLMQ